jgi:hypothetical protein
MGIAKLNALYDELLRRFGDTIEQISIDKAHNKPMTDSQEKAVNFDKFIEYYKTNNFIDKERLNGMPTSCDALYLSKSQELSLIEFKNGKIMAKKNYEIMLKALESLLILLEKLDETIKFARAHLTFILVYNYNNEKTGFEAIQNDVSSFAKERIVLFGLNRFKKLHFKEVYTYTIEEFNEYLTKAPKTK